MVSLRAFEDANGAFEYPKPLNETLKPLNENQNALIEPSKAPNENPKAPSEPSKPLNETLKAPFISSEALVQRVERRFILQKAGTKCRKGLVYSEKGHILSHGSTHVLPVLHVQINQTGGKIFMGRIRRTSGVIARAVVRSNNLKSISPTLDLGGGLTVTAFEQLIGQAQAAEADYNQTIASLDEKANRLDALLKETGGMSARLLAGVGARYGKNSDEYEKAGGVRTRDIKRSRKTKKDAAKP